MNISIRKMKPGDVDSVYQLEQVIFKDSWSYILLSSETDGDEYKKPFVLEVNGELAGYTFIWTIADEVHINNFAIHPSFRRKGLGLKLISFIFESFSGYKNIFLEVRVSNHSAIELYNKSGFKKYFVRKKYYSDGEDAIVMKKSL